MARLEDWQIWVEEEPRLPGPADDQIEVVEPVGAEQVAADHIRVIVQRIGQHKHLLQTQHAVADADAA